MKTTQPLFLVIFVVIFSFFFIADSKATSLKPTIQLANIYYDGINVEDYLVSEKLDGVRAYWDGEQLISRAGHIYQAPQFFIEDFPAQHLEGELWMSRGNFAILSGIVRRQTPNNLDWNKVRFMLFDMPNHKGMFIDRVREMKKLVEQSHSHYLHVIEQVHLSNNQALMSLLEKVVKNGGEGLMLHRSQSFYQAGRNDDVLKLKTFSDEEAVVISHISGKGKLKGWMGAMLVENQEGVRFKLGSGFSNEQRKSPPKIGSVVTYKFYGKTKNNIPRFASFMRVRE